MFNKYSTSNGKNISKNTAGGYRLSLNKTNKISHYWKKNTYKVYNKKVN